MTPHSPQTFLAHRSDSLLSLPGQGRSAAKQLTRITDQYFIHSFAQTSIAQFKKIFVVAVGSYGRSELCLKSDIDVVIIANDLSEADQARIASQIFHPLWDHGLDVGHAFRDIKDCLSLANKDYTVMTSLLDSRFICGDREYFSHYLEQVNNCIEASHQKLMEHLIASRMHRSNIDTADSYMEPDIKEDPGGFRDYNIIGWLKKLSKIRHAGSTSLESSDSTAFNITPAMDFLFDVRNVLHSLSKRKNNRLHLDLQPEVAAILGYKGSSRSSGTEIFLGHLFDCLSQVRQALHFYSEKAQLSLPNQCVQAIQFIPERSIDNQCLVQVVSSVEVNRNWEDSETSNELSQQVKLFNDKLYFEQNDLIVKQRDSGLDLKLVKLIFETMSTTGVEISTHALLFMKQIARSSCRHDDFLAGLRSLFLYLLFGPRPGQCLKAMRQCGFLELLVPELEEKWYFVQFDGVHTYPLGEHTMHCLDLLAGNNSDSGFMPEHLNLCKDDHELRLAALLHDIGKGARDHSQAGADMALRIMVRFDIDQLTADIVACLIKNHLLMAKTALKRDIDEEDVVAEFARKMGNQERLRQLTMLSYADSKATGPRVWNSWQQNLLRKLYFKAQRMFSRTILAGHHAGHRMAVARDRIRSHPDYSQSWEKLMDSMPSRYLLKVPVKEVIKHTRLVERFQKFENEQDKALNVILLTEKGPIGDSQYWNLILISKNQTGLLSKVAGCLSMNQIEIYSAGLFTWDNGIAVDMFKVSPPRDPLYARQTWQEVRRDLSDLMSSRKNAADFCMRASKSAPAGSRFRINLDNESSDFYSIVEIITPRHPCLTWQLSQCLANLNLDICFSVISTHMDQASHVFYLRTDRGEKLFGNTREVVKMVHAAVRELFPANK
ncbi:MAG: HD domain-containing protein [Desulfonatronovibrio sp. MSAO_Bac4]|nr:MAG: HD domain-containing protein [Desulfonatronovibrio sp. MSAO_Bac4]